MKKFTLAAALVVATILIFSFKAEDKRQLVTITMENEALSKTHFKIIEAGLLKEEECKQKDQYSTRAKIVQQYIDLGYQIESTNTFAVMVNSIYYQNENIYLVK